MNIAQIAKLAGVSNAAVSRYFNNGYLSQEKKEAIRRVVQETGYHPAMHAQALRTRKTLMIGVVAPKMASSSMGRIVDGLLSVLNESNYQMLLAVTQNNPQKEVEYLKAFQDKKVDGIILIATEFTQDHYRILEETEVPVVIVGQYMKNFCCVYHDDYGAMYDMTMHMLSKGRKKLGYIGVTGQDEAVGRRRLQGYCDAVEKSGFPELKKQTIVGGFSFESGYEKAAELIHIVPDLNGLICATDEIAAGAVQYFRESGYKMPQEILVSGLGDSNMAKAVGHSMMTIHYFYEKSGKMAASMLLSILTENEPEEREIKLGYYLVDH